MKTVGDIFKETRTAKKISLETVEEATKIRKKFLVAMEDDEYQKLPSAAYAKGFIKNYSIFLQLAPEKMLAFYRRQTKEIAKSSLLPKGVSDPLNAPLLRITPTRFIVFVVVCLTGIFLLYFGLQYQKLQMPPNLEIDSPKEDQQVKERRVDVLGKTDPDATVAINGITILVRSDGQFFDQVAITAGDNTISVTATSRYGKSQTQTRKIIGITE